MCNNLQENNCYPAFANLLYYYPYFYNILMFIKHFPLFDFHKSIPSYPVINTLLL